MVYILIWWFGDVVYGVGIWFGEFVYGVFVKFYVGWSLVVVCLSVGEFFYEVEVVVGGVGFFCVGVFVCVVFVLYESFFVEDLYLCDLWWCVFSEDEFLFDWSGCYWFVYCLFWLL